MSYSKAREALESRLYTTVGLPSEIAWESIKYTRTENTPYMEVQFIPTSRRVSCIAENPIHRSQGLLRVIVYVPQGSGTGLLSGYIDNLVERFNTSTSMTEGDTVVRVDYAEPERVIEAAPWTYQTVNIGWYYYSR